MTFDAEKAEVQTAVELCQLRLSEHQQDLASLVYYFRGLEQHRWPDGITCTALHARSAVHFHIAALGKRPAIDIVTTELELWSWLGRLARERWPSAEKRTML
jgi:hypothetical protein